MAKKLILDPILPCLAQIWTAKIFFRVLPLLVVWHCSKLSYYDKKYHHNFESDFGSFWPKFGPNFFFFFFSWVLPLLDFYIVSSYHCTQFQGKPINQTWENGKKPSFGPDFSPLGQNMDPKTFSWILPLLHIRHCCKLYLYAISRKTNEPNLRK